MNLLAAFKSRSDALKLHRLLLKSGLSTTVINTPSQLGLGCGLSVVFASDYRGEAERLIFGYGLNSFVGFYSR